MAATDKNEAESAQTELPLATAMIGEVVPATATGPMLLGRLEVTNYRSIVHCVFTFGTMGVLIGKNNVGKTNVLCAIAHLLEGTAKTISEQDFNDGQHPITIEAQIRNVRRFLHLSDDKHRPRIEACILSDDSIRIRRVATVAPLSPGKLEIWEPEKSAFGNPTGIDAALKQLLPEVIHIEAFIDPAGEAEGKEPATLGRILKAIMEGLRGEADVAIADGLSQVNKLLNVIKDGQGHETDERAASLREVEQSVSGFIADGFQGASARIRVELPELPQLLGRAKVDLHDGDRWTEARLKGQGQQRALYVALLRTLAQQKRRESDALARPFILLMEEPEVFLHPSAHVVLRRALDAIARNNQVLFTTHSPTMVSPMHVRETIRIRKQGVAGGEIGTVCLNPLSAQLVGKEKRVKHLFEYPRSAKFLFADKVLVVEGISDMELLEAMIVQLGQQSFDDYGLACIDAQNKTVLKESMEILANQGLETFGIVDLDFLWRGCGTLMGADPPYQRFQNDFMKRCESNGWLEDGKVAHKHKREAAELIESAFASDAAAVRRVLRETHRIWLLAKGEIEEYAGLSGSAKGDYTEAAIAIRAGDRPIQHVDEIRELCRCVGISLTV